MADNRGQGGGVRGLLAKFENNNNNTATSPPSRGRSPVGSEHSVTGRPLSKVRASFVAVERSGQGGPILGLRRANGVDESPSRLKTGFSADDTGSPIERTNTGSSIGSGDKGLLDKTLTPSPPTTRSARLGEGLATGDIGKGTTEAGGPPQIGKFAGRDTPELGKILKGSSFEQSPQRASKHIDTTNTSAPSAPESPSKLRGTPRTANANTNTNGKPKDAPPTLKPTAPAPTKKVTHRPSNISINKDASSNKLGTKPSPTKASKSPRAPRTPTTQTASKTTSTRPAVSKPAEKETAKAPIRKPSRMSLNPASKANTKPQPSLPKDAASSKPATTTAKTQSKTRSPTRPVKLPASMTAPTASSAARLGPGGPSSRASSRAGTATTTLNRKPSSLKPDRATGTASTRTSTIRKQPSRVSLSPQRSRAQDRPSSRVSSTRTRSPDEGFLARMMRPTASSASKTHEKVEPKTPPKVARPPRKITSRASDRPPTETLVEEKVVEPPAISDKAPSIVEPTPEPVPEVEPELPREVIPEPPAVSVTEETPEPAEAASEPVEAVPEPVEAAPEPTEVTPEPVETVTEEPAVEEPSVEEPTAKDPVIEEPVAEEPVTEESAEAAPEAPAAETKES
ncbi:hypothetical protein FQN54_003783 [Arachnomyces sp. PD_36]|nr:hypothetical protein FQN54_003783 [Arachnomyces sp. PD_36]